MLENRPGKYNSSFDQAPRVAIAPQSVTTEVDGKVLDTRGFRSGVVHVALNAVTTGGAPGAQLNVKLTVQHGDEPDGSDMVDFVEADPIAIVVDDNDGDQHAVAVYDCSFEGAKRYTRVQCLVDTTGTVTLSSAVAAVVCNLAGAREYPESGYDKDGYVADEEINA